jgi:2-hydroxy-6-oxonona-2,4-dienedioate hydrolase
MTPLSFSDPPHPPVSPDREPAPSRPETDVSPPPAETGRREMRDDGALSAPLRAMEMGDAAAAWARWRRAKVGRWSVRYREAGLGPPVVLVHGLAISADYWYRNGPPLAALGLRVMAPDLPGFGWTDGPSRGLTVTEQAEAVLRWADARGIGRAVYVGHSLSCQSVLELAARAPERVAGLVLAAPTGDPRPGRWWRETVGLLLDGLRESPALYPIVAQAYLAAGPVRYARTWASALRHDPWPALRRVRAPGLVVSGADDPIVSPAICADFARGFAAGGRCLVVPDAAHAVIFDRPDAFNGAVLDFVSRTVMDTRDPSEA